MPSLILLLMCSATALTQAQADGADELAEIEAVVREADRDHWSFRPVVRPEIPTVAESTWVRNPIDNFILARLEERSWKPSAEAEPHELLRRVYLDLLGLPPTLEEQDAFLKHPAPEALDALIERLLCRPEYGERWGRHWLDLVRYAESNGYERDAAKPQVWRYRDYVIRAMNGDKPFDRFILEQLAGDELDDASTETIIATGYYRLGPWDDEPADPLEDRYDQLDDILNTTSQVFLGLTLACARCHNHKFEPLTALDYYRMVAVFNTLSRPREGRTELDRPAGTRHQLEGIAVRDRRIAELQQEIDKKRATVRARLLAERSDVLPAEAAGAFRTPAESRTDEEKKLVERFAGRLEQEIDRALDDRARGEIQAARHEIAQLRIANPDPPPGYFLEELSPQPAATFLLRRGKATNPGPEVSPGVPSVVARTQPQMLSPGRYTSRRRLSLANWIASPQNPLTARVIVNRVWQQHFGHGLVRSASDFGVMGDLPTHPELLDWLADWFVREADWSLKRLHKLIMCSATYRLSRRGRAEFVEADPSNKWISHTSYRRLEVEAMRDSMLAVSGQLNRKMYGPGMYPFVPREAMAGHSDPDKIWPAFEESEASRRTIYAFVKRSLVVPMLEVLDLCDTTKSSPQRNVTSVAPQALTMWNGDFVNRQASYFARRLEREAGGERELQVELAFRLALARKPREDELREMVEFLREEAARLAAEPAAARAPADANSRALEQLCRAILNLNEFVYPD